MNKVFFGDCRETMRKLIAQGVKARTRVTSPPYWGLRDYGVEGQLGLERTPDEYVANMVEVFRLVRDVLADDGTLWLILGDSYAVSRSYQVADNMHKAVGASGHDARSKTPPPGLKQKDLVGIPWMLAFALRADGWWFRQDIIWHKPNPMPESVRDRCTKAHEYVFLLSKSERYFFDQEAIKEPVEWGDHHRNVDGPVRSAVPGASPHKGLRKQSGNKSRKPVTARGVPIGANGRTAGAVAASIPWEGDRRNKRSVWSVPTKPYNGAHFATYPPELIEPCILAGSQVGDIVLDPFFGSGTTGEVAQRLGRQWVACEINPEYAPLQAQRTAQTSIVLG